jgi:type VI secretion system protein ImpH
MATQERGQDPDLRELLSEQFYRFEFFQAAALIESFSRGKKPIGEATRPRDEAVRFKVRPGFAFPASDLSGLRLEDPQACAELDVSFLGLIGPNGVLPHWYNELALERQRAGDASMVEFFNLFHHRILSLFYLAWKRARINATVARGAGDRFSGYFRRMLGISDAGAAQTAEIGVEPLLYLTGILARRVPSVAAIAAAVGYRSGQPARVEQFIERVLQLPPEERTALGRANAVLGESTVCGQQVCESSSKFRVKIGPMGGEEFCRFLPGGDMLRPIFALVRFIVGIEFEFDLCIILRRDQVPGCRLGSPLGGFAPLLGWSTWLKAPGTVLQEDQRAIFEEPEALSTH